MDRIHPLLRLYGFILVVALVMVVGGIGWRHLPERVRERSRKVYLLVVQWTPAILAAVVLYHRSDERDLESVLGAAVAGLFVQVIMMVGYLAALMVVEYLMIGRQPGDPPPDYKLPEDQKHSNPYIEGLAQRGYSQEQHDADVRRSMTAASFVGIIVWLWF